MTSPAVDAVLFDMDGTLIHTEHHTENVVARVLLSHGVNEAKVTPGDLYGLTWAAAGSRVKVAHPELAEVDVGRALMEAFADVLDREGLRLIPGSTDFFEGLQRRLPVGLCTSNVRAEVARLQREYPVFSRLRAIVTGEDVRRSKPDPEGYLKLAEAMKIAPERCMVFEDSIAGLQAARAAGMQTVAVLHGSPDPAAAQAISDHAIDDYTAAIDDGPLVPGLPITRPSTGA